MYSENDQLHTFVNKQLKTFKNKEELLQWFSLA